MPLSLQVSGADKATLAISLAALVLHDSKADISADNLLTVLSASSIEVPTYLPALYANYIGKAGGVEMFFAAPGAGGGGAVAAAPAAASGGGATAPTEVKKEEKPKEEEVDALDGGMDMFGGGGGGGGDY